MKKIKVMVIGLSVFLSGEIFADCGCKGTKESNIKNAKTAFRLDKKECKRKNDNGLYTYVHGHKACIENAKSKKSTAIFNAKILYASCLIDCALKEALGKAK